MQLLPVRSHIASEFRTLKVAGDWTMDGAAAEYKDGATIFTMPYDPGKQTLVLKRKK